MLLFFGNYKPEVGSDEQEKSAICKGCPKNTLMALSMIYFFIFDIFVRFLLMYIPIRLHKKMRKL